MKFLRRWEIRCILPSGTNTHISWHVFLRRASRVALWHAARSYGNDGERDGRTHYYIRRVGTDGYVSIWDKK